MIHSAFYVLFLNENRVQLSDCTLFPKNILRGKHPAFYYLSGTAPKRRQIKVFSVSCKEPQCVLQSHRRSPWEAASY